MPRAPLAPRILGQTFLRKVYAVFDPWKPAVWLADRRSVKVQEMQKALEGGGYPLVNVYITMENHHFQWVNPL